MPTDLITTAELLVAWPGASALSSDQRTAIVTQASLRFEAECDRRIGSVTLTETHRPGRSRKLYLRERPVTAVSRLAASFATVATIQYTGTGRATFQYTGSTADPDSLTFTGCRLVAGGTTTNLAFATYTTLGALKAAVNAVSGWSMSTSTDSNGDYADWSTSLLNYDVGAQQAGTAAYEVKAYTRDLMFTLDYDGARKGVIELMEGLPDGYRYPDRRYGGYATAWTGGGAVIGGVDPRVGNVQVSYTAGYATSAVPADVKRAVATLAAYLHQRVDAAGLQSESAKDYSYTLQQSARVSGLPDEVSRVVELYRRKEIA